jgi:hypothetical protein
MLGKLLYQYKKRFGSGLATAWYRDVVRKRILHTRPVVADDGSVCEIHVLTSESDWLNLIWALKSFYQTSGRRYSLCIHDDGSLNDLIRTKLRHHFPAARIVDRNESDGSVVASLSDLPLCRAFRETNHLAPKVFDFRHYLNADRMLVLDSDVLFFAEPTELLRRIEDPRYRLNTVNRDVKSAYTIRMADCSQAGGIPLVERFNSGLGLIHRESLRLDWFEEFLSIPGIVGHFWLIEQTLLALCSSRYGVQLLPSPYDVFLDGKHTSQPVRHYVGVIRHRMYSEGIAKLGWLLSR